MATVSNSRPFVSNVVPMHFPLIFLPERLITLRRFFIASYTDIPSKSEWLRAFNTAFKSPSLLYLIFRLFFNSRIILFKFEGEGSDIKESIVPFSAVAFILSTLACLFFMPFSLNQLSNLLLLKIFSRTSSRILFTGYLALPIDEHKVSIFLRESRNFYRL